MAFSHPRLKYLDFQGIDFLLLCDIIVIEYMF